MSGKIILALVLVVIFSFLIIFLFVFRTINPELHPESLLTVFVYLLMGIGWSLKNLQNGTQIGVAIILERMFAGVQRLQSML